MSFKVDADLLSAIDAEAARMLPGGKVSRSQAVKILLGEALAARAQQHKRGKK